MHSSIDDQKKLPLNDIDIEYLNYHLRRFDDTDPRRKKWVDILNKEKILSRNYKLNKIKSNLR